MFSINRHDFCQNSHGIFGNYFFIFHDRDGLFEQALEKNYLIGLILIFSISLFGCSSNNIQGKSEEQIPLANLTLEDVTNAFAKSELHLIPQIDSDYPKLHNVKPKAYELLDGIVFIYVFENEKKLKRGLNDIHDVYVSGVNPMVHEANNILVVYLPGQPKITPSTLATEINIKIQEIMQDLNSKLIVRNRTHKIK